MKDPNDPVTPLAEAAGAMREMYEEYVRAGFSKKEAFELVKETVRSMAAAAVPPSE